MSAETENTDTARYAWHDFEEDESTDAIPDKYVLTITEDGEEFATIVHRTTDGAYPIDGPLAERKRRNAARIVRLLNADPAGTDIILRAAEAMFQIDRALGTDMRHFDGPEMVLLRDALVATKPPITKPPVPTTHINTEPSIPGATPFNGNLLATLGLRQEPEKGYWRIPGTGWRIYDATWTRDSAPYVWGYDHDEDGKDYGEVHSLTAALESILWAEEQGMGDNTGYAKITVPAIQRLISALAASGRVEA